MNFIQICLKPDKKIKKFCHPASTKKDYFRIFRPTKTIIKASAAKTNVASGPAVPDAKATPAAVPLPGTMTAGMLNRLSVEDRIKVFLSRVVRYMVVCLFCFPTIMRCDAYRKEMFMES